MQKVAADASPDPRTGELAYDVTVVTAAAISGRTRRPRRGSGHGVDVELKVGERTILSYLTDRIFRLQRGVSGRVGLGLAPLRTGHAANAQVAIGQLGESEGPLGEAAAALEGEPGRAARSRGHSRSGLRPARNS